MDLRYSPPYHQQANGIVKRFMGTLRRLIITYIQQELISMNWDRLLPFFAFAHNTSHLDIIDNTPFYICHGRHARAPLVSAPIVPTPSSDSDPHRYVTNITSALESAYNFIIDHFRTYQDSLLTNVPRFDLDSQVLLNQLSRSNSRLGRSRKLLYDWVGPYKVIKIRSAATYDIMDPITSKCHYNVHISRIKAYFAPSG